MKVSRSHIAKFEKSELRIVLPRIDTRIQISANSSLRHKKTKPRLSNHSNKENEIIPNSKSSKVPKLNLVKIDEALNKQQNCPQQLQLNESDRRLLQATLNRSSNPTTYSLVDNITIENIQTERDGMTSLSKSMHVSHSTSDDVGTSHNTDCIKVQTVISKQKPNRCVTRTSKSRIVEDVRNVAATSLKNLRKRKSSEQSKDGDEREQKRNKPCSIETTSKNDDVENILRSHSSHNCADEIDQKINNVQLAQAPDGSFVRRDFVIRIKQYCMNQPATVGVLERSSAVVSSATKREDFNETTKKTRHGITLEKTIGINLRTRTKSMEKNCTKIVHSKYTETVEKCNKRKLNRPSNIVTRRKAASSSDQEFFYLPYRKETLFSSDKIDSILSESEEPIEKPVVKKKKCNSQKKSDLVSKEKLQQTVNKEIQNAEPVPSCSYTFPSVDVSIIGHSPITALKRNETSVLQEITLNRRESVREAKKKSQKIRTDEQRSARSYKENTKLSKQSIDLMKPTVKKPRNCRKASKQLPPAVDSLQAESQESKPSKLKEDKKSISASLRKTTKMNRSRTIKSTPKRYQSDDESVSPKPRITRAQSKKKVDTSISVIVLSHDDDNEEQFNPKGKKRMKKKVAQQRAEKFNEHRKSLESSMKKTRSRTASMADSTSKRTTRHSSKAQNESIAGNSSRYPLNVTFSQATPEVIPRRKNKTKRNWSTALTPCSVVLDKLDATDISTYAITPLREDRVRPPPKTPQDYGIDDVNTDDSTDDEDDPKKTLPDWVKTLKHQTAVQFHIPRQMIKGWIRPPKTAFTVKTLFV